MADDVDIVPIYNGTKEQYQVATSKSASALRNMLTKIEGISSPDAGLVRELLPADDLEDGADNTWNGTDNEWTQAGLTADQWNETYKIDSNANAQNKVVSFYGLANASSNVITTQVRFENTTGATFYKAGTQMLKLDPESVILFREPIIYGPTEDGQIDQWVNSAGNDELILLAHTGEAKGETFTPHNASR